MKVYCYRCGGTIEAQPVAKTVEVWSTGKTRITYESETVEHECPKPSPGPQDTTP